MYKTPNPSVQMFKTPNNLYKTPNQSVQNAKHNRTIIIELNRTYKRLATPIGVVHTRVCACAAAFKNLIKKWL